MDASRLGLEAVANRNEARAALEHAVRAKTALQAQHARELADLCLWRRAIT